MAYTLDKGDYLGWKEEFIDLMFKEKETYRAIEMYTLNAPDTLFRYRSGNDLDIETLKENKIWLSNMKCVNDKFEGTFEVIYGKEKLNFGFLEEYRKELVNKILDEIISKFYLSCFCESVTKINMWSYYANSSKGFCIEYWRDDFDTPLFPVIYKDNKIVDVDNIDESEMYKSIMTKDSDWEKEEEWRILFPYYGEYAKGIKIEQPKPKGIYLGSDVETTSNLWSELQDYCVNNGIDFYQMKLDKSKRMLIPQQITLRK